MFLWSGARALPTSSRALSSGSNSPGLAFHIADTGNPVKIVVPGLLLLFQSKWVEIRRRIVVNIRVEVVPGPESNWVLAQESASAGIQVARPVEVQPGF